MEKPVIQDDVSVQDLASEWDATLHKAQSEGKISVVGSRTSSPASAPAPAPNVTTKDVKPLVQGVGAVACRMAQVSPLTDEEAQNIAEPAAHLLTILAPNLPPWAIPAGTLVARIGEAVEARSDEFRSKRRADGPEQVDEGVTSSLVKPDGF